MGAGGLFLFGVLAALANLLGGMLLASKAAQRLDQRFLKYLIALGAGFMLAAIFIEILPETIAIWVSGHTIDAAAQRVILYMTLFIY